MRMVLGCALVVGTVTRVLADPAPRRTSATIEAALPPVRATLETCAMKQAFIGQVLVTLQIRADGGIDTVTLADTAPPKVADCLRGPLKRLKLGKGEAAKASHVLRLGGGTKLTGRDWKSINDALGGPQRAPLVSCATKAGFKGRVPVKLGIRANGQIVAAKFDDDTSPNFAKCLTKALTGLKLAAAETDTTVQHSLSLIPAVARRDARSIGDLLGRHRSEIDACGTKASFTGTVDLTLAIRDDGTVSSLKTPKGTGSLLTSCLTAAFKQLDLGPSQTASTVTYSLAVPFGEAPRDADAITSGLERDKDKIAACAKADHPASVSVTLTVRAEGTVASAVFAEGTPPELATCLSPIFTSLRLPRASAASELTYDLPL